MFETSEHMEMQKCNGVDAHGMNVFYYVAYYPYLNANA